MNDRLTELVKRWRRVSELAENAAREQFKAFLVENDPYATPGDIVEAQQAERYARRVYAKHHQRLSRGIDALIREAGIAPSRRLKSRIFDTLRNAAGTGARS